MEKVVLVDSNDNELGLMEKIEAHKTGSLHRAISVFLFNDKGEMLLQQRSKEKYHSPLCWTNACCTHPRQNESYEDTAHRRLREELGIQAELKYIFHFIYKEDVGGGLIEHELDYVFIGNYNDEVPFNPDEVNAVKWIKIQELNLDIQENPEKYTAWFKIIYNQYRKELLKD
ncbi:MAG: isopentenyl-diphosphate Delta-isomerase [Flavobacteriales bacterium]|nr:isopentenyl-diphosphate Delta-isomerase [Flavobacteriales bacterium]